MRPPSYLSSFYLSPPFYFFGRMTITATKQQQARRYAELYSHYHGRGGFGGAGNPWLGHRAMGGGRHDEYFWDEFESGRRGGTYLSAHEQNQHARADAFFRLQILQMILAQRGRDEDEDDEDEDEDDEVEDEEEATTGSADKTEL